MLDARVVRPVPILREEDKRTTDPARESPSDWKTVHVEKTWQVDEGRTRAKQEEEEEGAPISRRSRSTTAGSMSKIT
jgi:hypothetical protein